MQKIRDTSELNKNATNHATSHDQFSPLWLVNVFQSRDINWMGSTETHLVERIYNFCVPHSSLSLFCSTHWSVLCPDCGQTRKYWLVLLLSREGATAAVLGWWNSRWRTGPSITSCCSAHNMAALMYTAIVMETRKSNSNQLSSFS